jgi:quercetin dioxygenase-like cupin family protein
MKAGAIVAVTCAAFSIAVAGPISAHDGQAETGHGLNSIKRFRTSPHRHAKSAFIYAYVISGEIESKVNDGKTHIYKAGESWSEPPSASHPISRNASKTKPARLLAVFVVDSDDKALTTPVK